MSSGQRADPSADSRPVTLLALATTGYLGARLGDAPAARATVRVVVGGALALALTFGVGTLLGTGVA